VRLTRVLSVLTFTSFFLFSIPSGARAETSLGDSALTVAFATVGGAIMGASTLPFYETPGDHTKNIFYGAAIGAVVGVIISAYAGVQEGPDYGEDEEASLNRRIRPSSRAINEAPELRLVSEQSSATRKSATFAGGTTLVWSQLASVRF
jgi:hypothetical protein